MLKTTKSPNKPAFDRNNSSNPGSGKNYGNDKVNRFSVGSNSIEHTKKSGKSKA